MANIKSQIKRNKTNLKAYKRNKSIKSELKTLVRNTRKAIASKGSNAKSLVCFTSTKLDKAAQKNVVHKNYAANKKSKLAKKLISSDAK